MPNAKAWLGHPDNLVLFSQYGIVSPPPQMDHSTSTVAIEDLSDEDVVSPPPQMDHSTNTVTIEELSDEDDYVLV